MTRQENEQFVKNFFDEAKSRYAQLVGSLVDDPEAAIGEAAEIFDRMIPDIPYIDKRDHPMALDSDILGATVPSESRLQLERGLTSLTTSKKSG